MTIQAYTTTGTNSVPSKAVIAKRAPQLVAPFQDKVDDNGASYQYGQLWFDISNPANKVEYTYFGGGQWVESSTQSGAVTEIDGNTGSAVPSAGIINVVGTGSITATATGNTDTIALTGLTNHAVLVGAGTATITKLAVGATGTLLAGNTAADPAFTASPSGLTSLSAGTLTGTTSVSAGDSLNLTNAGSKLNIHATTAASDSVGTSAALDGASPSQQVVSTTAVTASSIIMLSVATAGGTPGFLSIGTIDPGVSFQILSSANGDTSTVNYVIIN